MNSSSSRKPSTSFPSWCASTASAFADSSAIPTFYLAKITSLYVTVALNGDGGDETFAGYDRTLLIFA
jgi:asparagine synthase (glutamine-hydrolysing)